MQQRTEELAAMLAMLLPVSTLQSLEGNRFESNRIGIWRNSPQIHVTATADELRRSPVDIQTPNGALMAIVSSQPLPVHREPNIRFVILRAGEQQVAFPVVLDLRDGTLVSLQHQRALEGVKIS